MDIRKEFIIILTPTNNNAIAWNILNVKLTDHVLKHHEVFYYCQTFVLVPDRNNVTNAVKSFYSVS